MDIYFDILSSARQPVRKTHIMYRSNLSYKQLDIYLNTLVDRNLIGEVLEEDARVYKVTSRGLNFMELFENISAYLAPNRLNPPSELVSERNGYEVIEKEPFVY